MKYLRTNEIRDMWIKFFQEKNHTLSKTVSLIPVNDDTLLWINSGVSAIKNYFDGSVKPPSSKIVNSQTCIRTNDINNVGETSRHHTLFEMLGSFSIGDYFKKEAIIWGWEFLTDKRWMSLPKDKLYITYYSEDQVAYDIWVNKVGISPDHMISGGTNTNFWEIGQGPCGPNTEIFIDRGLDYDKENKGIALLKENIDNDRYLELWNIVFSEFNNNGDGTYTDLPQKNIDTGMGLERMASVIQQVPTNFDTDQFQEIIKEIKKFTNKKYDANNFYKPVLSQCAINIAFKAIADHAKCNIFAIADGAIPSNEKRGYILRRLIRRATNMARRLDINKPFIYKIVDTIIDYNKDFFPHLDEKRELIKKVIKTEEENFLKTIDKGFSKLELILEKGSKISGEDAFLLFNSFGFPIELTEEIALEKKVVVDVKGFHLLFKKHKEVAKNSFKKSGKMNIQSEVLNTFDIESEYLYEPLELDATIMGIISKDKIVNSAKGEMLLAFDKTIFYAESGGQIADQGFIDEFEVTSILKAPNGTRLHALDSSGVYKVGDKVKLKLWDQRPNLMAHHSGSHIVHQVVKEMFGKDSNQAGKFVANNRIRFDFSTTEKVFSNMMEQLELLVNQKINEGNETIIKELPYEEAIKGGAIALFTEKYKKDVRTVKIGASYELCGGTHVHNSKDIEEFTLTSFESKGSGVYRIEGIFTKKLVNQYNQDMNKGLDHKVIEFISKHKELPYYKDFSLNQANTYKENVQSFNNYKKDMVKLNKEYNKKQAQELFKEYLGKKDEAKNINGKNVLVLESEAPISIGKEVVSHYKNILEKGIVIWVTKLDSKISVIIGTSKDSGISAKELIGKIAPLWNGKGGGSDEIAQSGGSDLSGFHEAIKKLGEFL